MRLIGNAFVCAMLVHAAASSEVAAQHAKLDIEDGLAKMLEGKRIARVTDVSGVVEVTLTPLGPAAKSRRDVRIVCAGVGADRAQIMIRDHGLGTDDRRTVEAGVCDRLFEAARKRFESQRQ